MTKPPRDIISQQVAETLCLGERLGRQLRGGEVIALIGQLGTGKTHFIKGLSEGLDIDHPDEVTSPTFTLINEYSGRLDLYHIDAYRLETPAQLEALGFDEMCRRGGVVVVEWADRVWDLINDYQPLTIRLEHIGPSQRRLVFTHLPDYCSWEDL